jgi:hypothetical protein
MPSRSCCRMPLRCCAAHVTIEIAPPRVDDHSNKLVQAVPTFSQPGNADSHPWIGDRDCRLVWVLKPTKPAGSTCGIHAFDIFLPPGIIRRPDITGEITNRRRLNESLRPRVRSCSRVRISGRPERVQSMGGQRSAAYGAMAALRWIGPLTAPPVRLVTDEGQEPSRSGSLNCG